MINILNLQTIINKERIFKKLHIKEGTEAFNNADGVFDELCCIIKNKMKITAVYMITDDLKLEGTDDFEKHIICFISSDDDISELSHTMITDGSYMKGYLLHEMAVDVVFAASNKVNNSIKKESEDSGYRLSRRYAPGDGSLSLNAQKILLDILKNETEIKAYLNEENVLVPENTLLYIFGLAKGVENEQDSRNCSLCDNQDCQYREIK